MNTSQLQYVLEIYRTGSMSKAAANLFITQPNLSNSIRSLEEELGFVVFNRNNHGVVPTEKGLIVIEQVRQMWDSYQEILQINLNPEVNRLRIGGFAYEPIFRAYERLSLQYQGEAELDFSLTNDGRTDFGSVILSDYDVQLGVMMPDNVPSFTDLAATKGLSVTVLKEIPVVLRCGPNNPLYAKENVTPADFSAYPFVDYTHRVFLDHPNLRHLIPIDRKRVATVNDRTAKHQLVSKGTFVSIGCQLPNDLNEKYHLRILPLPGISYSMILLEKKRQQRSPLAEQYVELLKEELETIYPA